MSAEYIVDKFCRSCHPQTDTLLTRVEIEAGTLSQKITLNLRKKVKKTFPVTAVADVTAYAYHFGQISDPDDTHTPLHLLQPCQARFLCNNLDYFWDSVE